MGQKVEEKKETLKKSRSINVFVLLFCVLVVAALFSYILPAGEYTRQLVNGRNIVVPGSYQVIPATPINPFAIFASIHEGMVQAGPIIFYVLIIGGMFSVINATGAIDALLATATRKLAKKEFLFISITMFIFSMGGSLLGMAEESLIYIPLVIPIALALGFDVITGTAIVLFGMGVGFTTAVMNPFTIGIAQSIAGLPMFSGISARLVLYVIMYSLAVCFVYNYAKRVKKDPTKGFYGDGKFQLMSSEQIANTSFETKHKLVLFSFVIALSCVIYGTMKLDWYMAEMSAVFIILSIVVSIITRMSADDLMKNFLGGAAGIVPGALVIGLARGIVVVLTNGHIIDTILNSAANALHAAPPAFCTAGMFLVQATLHLLVPSGSGQAMLTMPIMVPLADLLHVTRQTACIIFSLADGIGNTILPTSGYFMAALAISGIPWQKWAKRMLPLIALQYLIAIIAVVVLNAMHYGPF